MARIHARSARKEIKDILPSGARKPPALTARPPSAGYGATPEVARSQELTPVAAPLSTSKRRPAGVPVQDTPWTH